MRLNPVLGVVLALSPCMAAQAEEPVRFDVRRIFSCSEVKPPGHADASRSVVVVSIPISANFDVPEESIERLRYELRMPKSVTVLDFLPKSRSEADVKAQSERTLDDRQTQVHVEYGGTAKTEFNVFGARFSLGGGGERRSDEFTQVKTDIRVDRLPPRKQVIVAGTENEGQTLYFELPSHSQAPRGGQSEYAILAEVPKSWAGDVATIVCTARQNGSVAGRLTKVVGLYLSGDTAGRQRVEKALETARPAASRRERELITNSIGMKLRLIPAGSFLMGATSEDKDADSDEKPQHKVTITRPFYLGVHEVTQYEYRQIMGDNPSHFKDSDLLPVEQVSWLNAVKFCNKLSEKERRRPYYKIEGEKVTIVGGNGYRLPTEAEWEYACRAPRRPDEAAIHPFGDDGSKLADYAWFESNSGNKTHPVGQKKPNAWGLHDMQGNVWEWCQDLYSGVYYRFSPDADPQGPAQAPFRVIRGGSWNNGPRNCRPANRNRNTPDNRNNNLGFRVAAAPRARWIPRGQDRPLTSPG